MAMRGDSTPAGIVLLAAITAGCGGAAPSPGESARGDARRPPVAVPQTGATDETARTISALRRSGPSEAGFAAQAHVLFEAWRGQPRDPVPAVQIGRVDCFAGGCYARAAYSDLTQLDAMTREFYRSEAFAAFEGDVARSAPESEPGEPGRVSVVWLMTRPMAPR